MNGNRNEEWLHACRPNGRIGVEINRNAELAISLMAPMRKMRVRELREMPDEVAVAKIDCIGIERLVGGVQVHERPLGKIDRHRDPLNSNDEPARAARRRLNSELAHQGG